MALHWAFAFEILLIVSRRALVQAPSLRNNCSLCVCFRMCHPQKSSTTSKQMRKTRKQGASAVLASGSGHQPCPSASIPSTKRHTMQFLKNGTSKVVTLHKISHNVSVRHYLPVRHLFTMIRCPGLPPSLMLRCHGLPLSRTRVLQASLTQPTTVEVPVMVCACSSLT